uniref:Uncharacterized protein n=1 Tax=Cajanus cajan TaxID=3821 RepID=A0A151T9C8_CAJCA|nr:hypothetical protein KK1_018228 [Cajanus cajan]
MEQQEGDTWTMPPFWAAEHRDRRRLRRSYSLLLTSTSLLLLFLVLVLVFSLILVPTLHSFASNILRPRTVKNSWDSLNLVLVLFAIVCGFLGRNNANETVTPRSHYHNHRTFSNPSTPPPHCYHYNHSHTPYRSFNRLRSFNSYPDLRQQIAGEERFRFYDDTFLLRHHPQDGEIKEMVIEHVATAPPQSPPSQAVRRNVMPASQVETIQKHEETDIDGKISPPRSSAATRPKNLENSQSPPSPPSATQTKDVRRSVNPERNDMVVKSSPLSPPSLPAEVKTVTGKKKRGIGTKEFLTSLRGKKKKQRQRSVENFDSILLVEPLFPQPPPPPPPPPRVFQNLFSLKKGKHKNSHSVSVATASVSNKKENSSYNVMTTGNESPLIPIPPPPPPPPFKLPAWKFRVKGDYVRVDSIGSSRSGSPDLDEAKMVKILQVPDVDTKAHNFIESFRAGLRMAKMNSMKERQGIGRLYYKLYLINQWTINIIQILAHYITIIPNKNLLIIPYKNLLGYNYKLGMHKKQKYRQRSENSNCLIKSGRECSCSTLRIHLALIRICSMLNFKFITMEWFM